MEAEIDYPGMGFTKIRREGMIMSNEERIVALEKEVAELKRGLEARPIILNKTQDGIDTAGISAELVE